MVTEAAIKYGGWEKTEGLCNVPINCIHRCAEVLNKNTEDLTFKFAGLNHSHWQRVWDKEGNEITEELIGKLYDPD